MLKKAILLLNMGGPGKLEEVEIFLKNMFNDPFILSIKPSFCRKILAFIITFFRKKKAEENYLQIGGTSPINALTISLVNKMKALAPNYVCVDFAMNYTKPFANEVLKKYENFDDIILIPLYPHYSQTTVKSSIQSCKKAMSKDFKICKVFYENEKYNEILLNLIKDEISNFSAEEISEISLIFSAHSLPIKIIEKGDPYEKQIREHVEILSEMLKQKGINFKEIILAYQSRLGPVKWLGPNTGDVLKNLKNKKALIFPLAFCIDNSETVFELAVQYAKIVRERNFTFYKVCKCPNDRDEFAEFLLDLAKNEK